MQDGIEWKMKLDNVRRIYGSHPAMRLASEKASFSRNHRLPGLQSRNIGKNVVLGLNDKIEFSDFLNGISLIL
jgi:proteasome maturation protein